MVDEKDVELPEDVQSNEQQAETPQEDASSPEEGAQSSQEDAAPSEDEVPQEQPEGEGESEDAAKAANQPVINDEGVSEKDAEAAMEAKLEESAEEGADASAQGSQVVNPEDASEDDAEAAMMAMLEDLPKEKAGASPEDINFGTPQVSKAEFQHLSQPAGQPSSQNIDLLMDVNLPVSIELGRTKLSISEILGLGPGSVVELAKLAGEPVDLLVNYKVVARGEVVVIDENFGVRITQLLTPEERLQALGDQ